MCFQVCASLGATVLLTDNAPDVLRLLAANVAANLRRAAPPTAQLPSTAKMAPSAGGFACVMPLEWSAHAGAVVTEKGGSRPPTEEGGGGGVGEREGGGGEGGRGEVGTGGKHWDLILASEVAYSEEALVPLIITMRDLCSRKQKQSAEDGESYAHTHTRTHTHAHIHTHGKGVVHVDTHTHMHAREHAHVRSSEEEEGVCDGGGGDGGLQGFGHRGSAGG